MTRNCGGCGGGLTSFKGRTMTYPTKRLEYTGAQTSKVYTQARGRKLKFPVRGHKINKFVDVHEDDADLLLKTFPKEWKAVKVVEAEKPEEKPAPKKKRTSSKE